MENHTDVTGVRDNMEDKLLDIGSERAVLAGLLQHGMDAYVRIGDIVSEDSFVHSNNKIIYKCINQVLDNGQKPDISTLVAAAEQLHLSESINTKQEINYISSLYDFPIDSENVLSFAVQIKKFEFARKMLLTICGFQLIPSQYVSWDFIGIGC